MGRLSFTNVGKRQVKLHLVKNCLFLWPLIRWLKDRCKSPEGNWWEQSLHGRFPTLAKDSWPWRRDFTQETWGRERQPSTPGTNLKSVCVLWTIRVVATLYSENIQQCYHSPEMVKLSQPDCWEDETNFARFLIAKWVFTPLLTEYCDVECCSESLHQ